MKNRITDIHCPQCDAPQALDIVQRWPYAAIAAERSALRRHRKKSRALEYAARQALGFRKEI